MSTVFDTKSMSEEVKKENKGRAMGRVASGVHIVTLTRDGVRDGMLTSWLGQAGFEPLMLTFAVNKSRHILSSFTKGSSLIVNVLSKGNMDIFKNFAKPHTDGLDRFADLKVEDIAHGPVLTESVAYMGCKVESTAEAGDHVMVIASVDEGAVLNPDAEPMVHLRKNGYQY